MQIFSFLITSRFFRIYLHSIILWQILILHISSNFTHNFNPAFCPSHYLTIKHNSKIYKLIYLFLIHTIQFKLVFCNFVHSSLFSNTSTFISAFICIGFCWHASFKCVTSILKVVHSLKGEQYQQIQQTTHTLTIQLHS